jgi:phosphopantetheinyl transferase (holo-ACP synthase)
MSALIGLGIDLLDRRRLALLISKHTHGASRLANRILSERELASCQWRACMSEEKDSLRMVQYLANRSVPPSAPLLPSVPRA